MSTPRKGSRAQLAQVINRLEAQFVKSNFFRVVHADGAWGGLTPNGQIRMVIYSEAQQFPRNIIYDVPLGTPKEVDRNPKLSPGSVALLRELEVDVVLTLSVARNLHNWLGGKITELEQAIEAARLQGQSSPEEQR